MVMDQARKELKRQEDKQFSVFDDIAKKLYEIRKSQMKKFKEARGKGYTVYFSKAKPDKLFVNDVSDILKGARVEQDHPFIVGGDFNIILDHVLDGQGDYLEKGPNFWKFNSNLVNDTAYCELLPTEYANWLEEFKEVQDKRVLWDLIKYKIRQQTIR
ncbi:unnamed protein product [Porites evermanni]|uniref:Uncharacterized protein n=1 Tax=Porites evermanni TaxID=104178 RepID=A0ABN8LAU9_9CNID|nr:unnamed protein product [Porites evermanni]